jgi:predicted nucleic-acid-binding protein
LENVVVENEEIVYFTVSEYGDSKLDFVDELLYANSRIRGIEVKTFDVGLQGKINLLIGST